ncbi:acyltransferase [Paenibacillus sp. PL2-23]|uniref:acyltransferase n=1 Tax=Paenibacillus sp. PL2-23 TaxID=2100729 RepID=UPI0030F920F2
MKHREIDFMPWMTKSEEVQKEQKELQAALVERFGCSFGEECFVSPEAMLYPVSMNIGDRSYIAGGAIVRNTELVAGADCSINTGAVITGKVKLGDAVRIATYASLYGFNHGYASVDVPIHRQPHTSVGIEIGDDVWIGAHAVIVDGVHVGSHSIVAAGAIVTRDVPPYSVIAGNPAKVIRSRLAGMPEAQGHAGGGLESRLQQFGQQVRGELEPLLRFYSETSEAGEPLFRDRPGFSRTVRAYCDAVEIAALFGELPPGWSREALVAKLQSYQSAETGLLPDPWHLPDPDKDDPWLLTDYFSRYHLLAVGYALETLGARLLHPVHAVERLTTGALYRKLDGLPWHINAWSCGDWIDGYATGLYLNAKHFGSAKRPDDLMGWLQTHVNRFTGVWGQPTEKEDWLQPVNGFYRLTRATYAQFGLPLPYPERTIDTVLAHSRNNKFFREDRLNACNVLDVAHPLWLCMKQTEYRREEVVDWATRTLHLALGCWVEGRGFSFRIQERGSEGLQGTEMWLSIIYLLADICGMSASLGYRPQGVHRPDPAWSWRGV